MHVLQVVELTPQQRLRFEGSDCCETWDADIKVVSGEYVWSPCRDVESWEKTGDLEIPSSLLTSPEVLM